MRAYDEAPAALSAILGVVTLAVPFVSSVIFHTQSHCPERAELNDLWRDAGVLAAAHCVGIIGAGITYGLGIFSRKLLFKTPLSERSHALITAANIFCFGGTYLTSFFATMFAW